MRVRSGKSLFTSYVLELLQSVFLTVSIIVVLVYYGLLSMGAIERSLEQSGYYEGLTADIIARLEDALIPTGIPYAIISEIITLDSVEEHMRIQIRNEFLPWHGNRLDFRDLREELTGHIVDFLDYEQVYLAEEEIDILVDSLVAQYENDIRFLFIIQLSRFSRLYQNIAIILGIGSLFALLVAMIVTYRTKSWLHQSFRSFSYSLGGSACMLIVLPLAIYLNGFYTRLAIGPDYVYRFFITHVENLLWSFIITGIIVLIFTIILGIMAEVKRSKLVNQKGLALLLK